MFHETLEHLKGKVKVSQTLFCISLYIVKLISWVPIVRNCWKGTYGVIPAGLGDDPLENILATRESSVVQIGDSILEHHWIQFNNLVNNLRLILCFKLSAFEFFSLASGSPRTYCTNLIANVIFDFLLFLFDSNKWWHGSSFVLPLCYLPPKPKHFLLTGLQFKSLTNFIYFVNCFK